jgi:hypothetical protein
LINQPKKRRFSGGGLKRNNGWVTVFNPPRLKILIERGTAKFLSLKIGRRTRLTNFLRGRRRTKNYNRLSSKGWMNSDEFSPWLPMFCPDGWRKFHRG